MSCEKHSMFHKGDFMPILDKCWYLFPMNYFLNVTSHFILGIELINYNWIISGHGIENFYLRSCKILDFII
jgi:hypothetical protein